MWKFINKHLSDAHPFTQKSVSKVATKFEGVKHTFEEVTEQYANWLLMDTDSIDALRLIYAVVFSVRIPGDPVWMYLVGPSGVGKTVLLSSLHSCPEIVYRSSITPNTLVSGWKQGDPSLIPQLDAKCFLLKDFTEVISMKDVIQEEVFSILRGAYDGYVERSYGNGVTREYTCHFSMVAGVTGAIHGQTMRGAAMGDRFIKYQMRKSREVLRDQINTAMEGLYKESEMADELSALGQNFIESRINDIDVDKLICPPWVRQKVGYLVELVCWLRGSVIRSFHGAIEYRPEQEVGTRLAKQLIKLGWGLCIVEDKESIDWGIYTLLRRVALDTAEGFSFDIVRSAMKHGGQHVAIDILIEEADLPREELRSKLDDMVILRLLEPGRKKNPASLKAQSSWSVTRLVRKLWAEIESEAEIELEYR
jgi:hypothetical protein